MAKSYRPYLPEQSLLLAPNVRDWLPENHLAYFIGDVIDELDLSAIEAYYEREERGYPPYHPRMMTKILVYGYCVGVFSSRKLAQRLHEDIGFRVLAAGNTPDFRTLSEFRRIHLPVLQGLFEQVLRMALEMGAIKLGRIAIDGSKVKANASKHKAMTYQRMKQQRRQLREQVRQLLAEAERVDAAEDARYGRNRSGDELPAELQRREDRLLRIRAAKRALEQRAGEEAAEKDAEKDKDENNHRGPGVHPGDEKKKPKDKDQYNFTDPESRIMKGSDGFVQAYNAQVAVESTMQLIVAQTVTQQCNDKQQLMPMLAAVKQQSGQKPEEVLADTGYASEKSLQAVAETGVDAYIATGKQKHKEPAAPCPRGPVPKTATRTERMRRKLQTKVGRAVYARRKTIVEPVFGQIKQRQGFRQFLLRGVEKVRAEWALVCTAHNLLKLHRACCG
jgi:transposase